ncbi:hypothetical protein PV396_24640 [Streptomyces sp. ME02-8801-2C]|uniref:hypothetical protein n=1 Tax=Streptomyces sp. ME02-8801-2C TaxID=3028680 RepID=UPI0029AC36CC|nr:hypothetical protein [Streptomyces sp. ME02-8801-2C]MDX3455091.1 hypothetical protein [Streptomyces sp. ME02-8801-2C]
MPRPKKRPTADHSQIAHHLSAHPYEWGPVRVYPTAYSAEDIARKIQAAEDRFCVYGPAGYFETRTTPVEDGTLLEARYTGGISKPRRRPATGPTSADLMWADAITGLSPATGPNGTT